MPTANNAYGIRLKACFHIALTEADKMVSALFYIEQPNYGMI